MATFLHVSMVFVCCLLGTAISTVYIRSGDLIFLQARHFVYLAEPVVSKGWPAGNVRKNDILKGAHRIIISNDIIRSLYRDYIKEGDLVFLETVQTPYAGYDRLYCSDAGWIYYDQESPNEKQQWIIRGNPMDEGLVTFENFWFPGNFLTYYAKWATCDSEETVWVTTLTEKSIQQNVRVGWKVIADLNNKDGVDALENTYKVVVGMTSSEGEEYSQSIATEIEQKIKAGKVWTSELSFDLSIITGKIRFERVEFQRMSETIVKVNVPKGRHLLVLQGIAEYRGWQVHANIKTIDVTNLF